MKIFHTWNETFVVQALVLGLVICLLALPTIVLLRRRLGLPLTGRWTWVFPLLLIYLLGVISFTFLPLPDPATFTCNDGLYYPRYFAGWSIDFALSHTADMGPKRFVTWFFLQIYLNVLLFVPWGIFARWIFKSSLRTTFLSAFATSLLIELTQLTGIWGYFGCRYRTFDVDDMITNTLGAIIGWALVILVERLRRRKILRG